MSFLSGWNYRKPILYGTVFPGSNLTDFPKLFDIAGDTDIAAILSGGGGIAVTLADGTTTVPFGLYPETALASGDILMRALFSPLTAASTGDVLGYLYYDAGQSTTEDKAGTVANGYVLFMTLDQDPSGSAPQQLDWVTNTNIGTSNGTWSSGQLVLGQVGDGLDFNGSDDAVTIPNDVSRQPAHTTVSILFKRNGNGAYQGLVAKPHNGPPWSSPYVSILMRVNNDTQVELDVGNSTYSATGFTVPSLGTSSWHSLDMTYNGTTLTGYLDGSFIANDTTVSGNITYTSTPWVLGADYGSAPFGEYADAILDEFAVSDSPRSADWIAYAHSDNFDNADTFSLGAQETNTSTTDLIQQSGYKVVYLQGGTSALLLQS